MFNDLDSHIAYFAVTGFSNDEVLSGRPFGGCAILWHNDAALKMERVNLDSRRIVAAKCEISNRKLLLVNAYFPCDASKTANYAEFFDELLMCESLLDGFQGYEMIIGGDFNVDLNRHTPNTECLSDFCKRCTLTCADFHVNANIDYTYHFSDERYSTIDHFILNEYLFSSCVKSVFVSHDINNFSDHDP